MKKIVYAFIVSLQLSGLCYLKAQDTVYARKVIDFLTSGNCNGRGYVGKGQNLAAKFLEKEFKQIGLLPLGTKKYFQPYTMAVNTFPGKMEVSIDGKKLVPGVHFIVENSSCSFNKGGLNLFKADSVTYMAIDGKQPAPVIVSLQKKLTWSVAPEAGDKVIIELLKDSFKNELKTVDIQIENKLISAFKTQNIVGYIPGTTQKDSFIVFTAHYDHLGAMGKSTFFPGANDNASGVSMLLNLAKHYAVNKPAYSVAFILFSGEEAGLLGSRFYSQNPTIPLSKMKFLVNLDLLGTGDEGITVVNATEFKPEFDLMKKINEEHKLLSLVKPRGKAQNSDHYWFTQKGVRCFFIYTMGGIKAYHDVYDISATLPLTKYTQVFQLLTKFIASL